RIRVEQADLGRFAFVGDADIVVADDALVGNQDDTIAGCRIPTEQARDPELGGRFLEGVPGRGVLRSLAYVDKRRREGPLATLGGVGAAGEEDLAIALGDDSDDNLRVDKLDVAAVRAGRALMSLDRPVLQC